MATYLMLLNWTDQGMRNIKESPKRMDAAKKLAKDFGGQITTVYMTQGSFDLALVAEMPNDEKAAGFVLKLGSLGNVRSTTLKAYSEDDYRNIIGGLNYKPPKAVCGCKHKSKVIALPQQSGANL